MSIFFLFFFFSSRRRHTRSLRDWSSDVCSSDLIDRVLETAPGREGEPAGDHDHALGAAAEADVALEPKQLRLRARVGDEEGPGHRDYCEGERDLVPVA